METPSSLTRAGIAKQVHEASRQRLLAILAGVAASMDTEAAHCEADEALLDYIDDPEIRAAYDAVPKWYA